MEPEPEHALWYTEPVVFAAETGNSSASVLHRALSVATAALHDRALKGQLPAATAAEEADTAGGMQLDELHELLMEHFETVRGLRLDPQLGDGSHFARISTAAPRDTLFFGLGAGGVGIFRECLLPFSRALLPSSIGRGKDSAPFSDADALSALLLSTALGVRMRQDASQQPSSLGGAAARRLIARETARLSHSAFWFATLPTHCPLHSTDLASRDSLPSGVHSRLLYLSWIIMLTDERYFAPFDLVWVQGLRAQALLLESLLPRMAAKGHLSYTVLADQDSEALQQVRVPTVLSEQEQAHADAHTSASAATHASRAALLQVNFTNPAADVARNGRPLLLWLGAPPHLHVHAHAHSHSEGEGDGATLDTAASHGAAASEVALVPAGVESNARIAYLIRSQLFGATSGDDISGSGSSSSDAPWELLRPALATPRMRRSPAHAGTSNATAGTPAAPQPAAAAAGAASSAAAARARAAAAAAAAASAARAEAELASHHEAASRDTAALQDLVEAMHREAAEAAEAAETGQMPGVGRAAAGSTRDEDHDDAEWNDESGEAEGWGGGTEYDELDVDLEDAGAAASGGSSISDADLEAALAEMLATGGGTSDSSTAHDTGDASSASASAAVASGVADSGFQWASDSAHFGRYEYLLGERLRRDAAADPSDRSEADSDMWDDWDEADGRQEL